ncbi:PQQ-binding-like beta-propeller repeat protein [Schlesneria sp. DSM 10557]|uniref:outer membrane protein assembly factor BamB family protein n=2 Tax=unclassified Schlesneria TaxID=2762017 RepID=UPI00359FD708
MASLKLQRNDGSTESFELSRSQPMTIGRQPFNDICISDADIAAMHCRVSWNKTGFEVTAATGNGVEVNSKKVAHLTLKSGDVIQLGESRIVYDDPHSAQVPAPELPPLPPPPPATSRKRDRKPQREEQPEDLSLFEGPVITESQAMIDSLFGDEDENEDDFLDVPREKSKKQAKSAGTLFDRPPVRPGEQEVLKSPLVLALAGGGLALLLITGIFWFLMAREQTNRMYDRAVAEMNDGQYSQAIASFERFIEKHPRHALRRQAERGLAKSQIQKEISGAVPSWEKGLARLNEMIRAHRNDSDFSTLHSTLFQYAEQIALGSAKTAETSHNPDLLVLSKDAQDLLERYSDPAAPPTGTVARIVEQRGRAKNAIEKQRTFDTAMAAIDAAIADKKPMVALSERERLVRSFPDFKNVKRVKDAQQKALDLEKSLIATDETERAAETTDEPRWSPEPVLAVSHSRSRMDDQTTGRIVFVTAKDSCYAVDPATGELVWRRVVGFQTPFFPIVSQGSQSLVVLFDTRSNTLQACQVATGQLAWKQPLNAPMIGKPLIHEGQLYCSLRGNKLVRIEVETGRLSATVSFSQNLATPPVLSRDGNHLLVPGEIAMIYSLSVHTTSSKPALSATATTFTDHSGGSVTAPPLMMGDLLLVCENDRAESTRLRLWNASQPGDSLVELNSTRINGQVRDTPVLRGNQLVVPSSGEQFAAFAVSDEPGHQGIVSVGEYRADTSAKSNQLASPLFVALGPDNQFWSAGSAFRRFEITGNAIRMDSNFAAPGIASQPLQAIGEQFFVARKSRYSEAVTFSAFERERLTSPWRCILGDGPLTMVSTRDGGLISVGESGTVYNIGKTRLAQGGIELKSGTDLNLPANISHPLRATVLHDQRIAIVAAGETVQMHVLNASGQLVESHKLDEIPQTDPVQLNDGIVVPLPSRLKLLSGNRKAAQDLILPVGESDEHRWTHLVRISDTELIAIDGKGRLTRVQFRTGDIPHLASAAELQLDHPVDVMPLVRGETLYVADAQGSLKQLSTRSFDVDSQISLPAPIRQLWEVGQSIVVRAGDQTLRSLSQGKTLTAEWTYPLEHLEPVGPALLVGDQLWLGCRNGTVLVLDPRTGTELRRVDLPQGLSIGLRQIQETLYAVAADGTLYRLN